MIRYCLFIAFALFSFCERLQGQNQHVIDSLREVLRHKTGGDRFPALYDLTFEYVFKDNEKALSYIILADQAALLSGDSLWVVKSKRVKGQILHLLERNEESKDVLESVLPLTIKYGFKSEQLPIEDLLGKLYLYSGAYDRALISFFNMLDLSKDMNNSYQSLAALHNIGLTYYKIKAYQKALDYYLRSVSTEEFDPHRDYFMLANIGLCYAFMGDFQNARNYVDESLRFCQKGTSNAYRINIEYAFGVISLGEKNIEAAEVHLMSSYEMARNIGNTRFALDNIYLLMDLYIKQGKTEHVKDLLSTAERLIEKHPPFNLELIKIFSKFHEYYLAVGNHGGAFHYLARYSQLKDSIYNEALTTSLMKIESEHLERENEARISAQEEIILLKQQSIDRQIRINFLTAAFGILMAVFAFFIYRNFRLKQNLNRILDEKVKQRTCELERNRNELMAALNEREIVIRRISQGITDAVSTLSGLSLTLIQERTPPVPLDFGQKIEKTCQRLKRYLLFGEGERALKA